MPSYQSTDVYVQDSVTKAPVEGVLVRVFDETGSMFFTQAMTDSEGRAGFTLYTRDYSLRFYKSQVSFKQPQLITVLEGLNGAPLNNDFQVYADVLSRPVALDPLLCRASGFFRDISGQPQRNLDIIFSGAWGQVLLDNSGVLPDKRMIRTDANGFACIDLIRCAQYSVTLEALEDQFRTVSVPDSPSVNLPDLLFPVAQSVSYTEEVPPQLSVGTVLSLTPSVLTSSGILLAGTAQADVRWSVSDQTVVALSLTSTQLELRALKAGTIELRAERKDNTIVQIPFSSYLSGSVVQLSVV